MAPITSVKLNYFDTRARGELCRWVIHQAGIKFEERRLGYAQWLDVQTESPTNLAPWAVIDGKTLASSKAISYYVAKNYDLMGSDDWEAAEIQMCVDLVGDTFDAAAGYMFCKDKQMQVALTQQYGEKVLPRLMNFINRRLESGNHWLVGNKLSLADISAAQFLMDQYDQEFRDQISKDSGVTGFCKRVADLPNIKKWIDSRPEDGPVPDAPSYAQRNRSKSD